MFKKLFLRDSIPFGMMIGFAIPLACFYLLVFLNNRALVIFNKDQILTTVTMQLVALCANLPLFRTYMIKWDKEESGKGMLLATFVLAFVYIYMNRKHIL